MKRSLVALAAVSFAGLTGCAWMYTPQADTAGSQFQYRPGTGVVESVNPAPLPFTAAAGGSAPASAGMTGAAGERLNRLTIRMDDGRHQYIDTASSEFTRGTRVRLTDARLIEKQ
jgi:hypothetical protein